MRFVLGATSDVGRVRDGNEDSFLVDERLALFAVADGMGGHRAGEVASATALEALRAAIAADRDLDDSIVAANAAVFDKSSTDEELAGMGTTLTAAVASADGELVIGHVGDSRAYVLRDGALSQITEDHSLVEELRREGRITEEQAAVHPRRSVITRALGIDSSVSVDLYAVALRDGERLLLCSDGLTTMVRPADIAAILRREPSPQRAADLLADAANEAGGEDNITAIVIQAESGETDAPDTPGVVVAPASVEGQARPDPDDEPPPPPPSAGAASRPRRRPIRWALRIAVVAFPVLMVLVIAFGAVGWYARRTFYVGLSADRVTVYRGVPGGLLGWDPTVEHRTHLPASALTHLERDDLANGHRFSSRSSADQFVSRLDRGARARATPTTTTTLPRAAVPTVPVAPPVTG